MAMIQTAPRAAHGAFTVARIAEAVRGIVTRFRAGIEAARTAEALSRLSPQLREDIGITEADILRYRQKSFLL